MNFNNQFDLLLYQGLEIGSDVRIHGNELCTVTQFNQSTNTLTYSEPNGQINTVSVDENSVQLVKKDKPYASLQKEFYIID